MAKAKKSEETKKETKAAAPAADAAKKKAPAAAAKKAAPAKKATTQATSTSHPMIDTNLAASNAARLLVGGFKSAGNASANAPKQESAMFKSLKAGINKPSGSAMSNLLDKSHGPTDPTKSHGGFNKQVGHNQTYGADVNRTGVPRRTPG